MLGRWSLLLFGLVALAGAAAACEGLSPGDYFQTDAGCTLAFIVADAKDLYFATAGHCIQVDQAASNPEFGEFGVGAFHFLDPETGAQTDGSPGFDFALIRLKPDIYPSLNPKVCGFDGPTDIYNETPGDGGVHHWGHGMVFGDLGPTGQRRDGVALTNKGDAFYWTGAGVPGDSGSAVLSDDGRALGVLTHLTAGVAAGLPFDNGGTHIDRGFALAADAGFPGLRLVLAGEDPVKVLAEMRAASSRDPTMAATPVAPTSSPTSSRPTSGSPSNSTGAPSNSTSPTNASTSETGDGIEAARTEDATAPTKDTPFPALPALAALALIVALARRRRL